jgi:hypothetical protein
MTTLPALHLAESDTDDATELTATEFASTVALVHEVDEDDDTAATDFVDSRPLRPRRPAMVAIIPEVPDPSALSPRIPSPDRPTPELELLVLQQDNMRLLRENELHRQRLEELRTALDGARRASREALEEAERWKRSAQASADNLARVEAERNHFRAFSESGLWERIRGCEAFQPTDPEPDPAR